MPTTRAPGAAAEPELLDLPAELLQHIAVRLTLAHDIARTAPTCRAISVAVKNAFLVRPFSGEVVKLKAPDHEHDIVRCVAVAADGRIAAGDDDYEIKVFRDRVWERTMHGHDHRALQCQRRRHPAHLQASHQICALPGTAARRPPLRQRRDGLHHLHHRARARSVNRSPHVEPTKFTFHTATAGLRGGELARTPASKSKRTRRSG